jgi:hypothetical protein
MAFAWNALSRQPWRAYGLAEDLEFSWHLRVASEKVRFVPEARVFGEIISGNEKASKAQRLRWEKGRAELKTAFKSSIRQMAIPSLRKWLLLSDLKMPPLSRWMIFTVLSWILSLSAMIMADGNVWLLSLAGIIFALNSIALFYFALYLSLPFTKLHLPWKYLSALSKAPFYILWKLMLLMSRTPAQWVRTERMNKGN